MASQELEEEKNLCLGRSIGLYANLVLPNISREADPTVKLFRLDRACLCSDIFDMVYH